MSHTSKIKMSSTALFPKTVKSISKTANLAILSSVYFVFVITNITKVIIHASVFSVIIIYR